MQQTANDKRLALKKLLDQRKKRSGAPLSFGQERLWFIDQLTPDSAAYNLRLAIRLSGEINVDAMQRSVNAIVARHAVLRSHFVTEQDRPRQLVADQLNVPLDLIELQPTNDGAEATMVAIHALGEAEARQPFDLATGPLLRSKLLRVNTHDHVLLVTMHHSVSDGWSLAIFMQELAAGYQANGTPALPPLPMQYGDYASWQRERFAAPVVQQQLAYWRNQLDGHQPSLNLPTDHPRPRVQTFNGDRHYFTIDAATNNALQRLQQGGITQFMILLAAYKVLLFRYSGQDDILVGTPVAGRSSGQLEPLIGLFINTLVLRSTLSSELPFSELLQALRQTALDAYANQDVPFEKLVEALQPQRDPSRNPLFQVLFTLQNAPQEPPRLAGLKPEMLQPNKATAQFDLSLTMWKKEGDALGGYLEYNSDLYDAATVARMVGHYQQLLLQIGRDANRPISQLPLLDSAETDQILNTWNATKRDYNLKQLLPDRFEAQAAQTPNRRAVICNGQSLTYGELNARANAVAQHLQTQGIGANQLVGLAAERSLEMLIGLLGILKSGAAYVPIDPDYPAERVQYMIDAAELDVIVTQSHLQDRYAGELTFVLLDQLSAETVTSNPQRNCQADDRAYIIFTSGSTGKPKGVEIAHKSLVNFLLTMQEAPGLSASDRLLAVTTISFDIATLELYLPLINGAEVIIATSAEAQDSYALIDLLTAHDVNIMQATPATWRMLLSAEWQGNANFKILSGGEALPQDLAQPLLPRCGQLWNVYGPTEATVWATVHQVTAADVGSNSQPVTIGKPIANTSCYVLDQHMQPVPIGVVGDLYIGGVQVALGYLGRPDLTAERFLKWERQEDKKTRSESTTTTVLPPFSTFPLLVYKTGDLARYRANGDIEFLGRSDFQVKIRGFRIELGEIEAQLAQHKAIRQAVVTARPGRSGEQELIAYIVTSEPTEAQTLRDFLATTLPLYMIPSRYVTLDKLPLTNNGKVNRKALPDPGQQPVEPAEYVAPSTPTEQLVANVWQAVLGLDRVSINDNFFELGGESILGIQVIGKLRKAGLTVAPTHLFQYQTVAAFATAFAPSEAASKLPLTPQQLAVSAESQHTLTLRYHQPLTPDRLRAALEAVAMQHSALRLERGSSDNATWQSLGSSAAVCFCLPGVNCENQTASLHVHMQSDSELTLIAAAWLVDGAALPLIVSDLFAAYERLKPIEPTAQFNDWIKRLSEAEAAPLPLLPPVAADSRNGQHSQGSSVLSAESTAQLNQLVESYNITPAELLLTAVAQVVGTPILFSSFQRHISLHNFDAARTVGNLRVDLPLPLGNDLPADSASLLDHVKQTVRTAQGWSFNYAAQQFKDSASYPRHNTVFSYYPPIAGANYQLLNADLQTPSCALHVSAIEMDDQLHLRMVALGLVSAEVDAHLNAIITQIEQLLAHCVNSNDSSYSPTDFPDADLDADDLSAFLSRFGD